MRLTGRQFEEFVQALCDAFDARSLERTLLFRLDKKLAMIAPPGSLMDITFDLLRAAEAEGWTLDLLRAARESNPGNPLLLAFAQQIGAAPATPPRPELERIIRASNSFLDVNQWRARLGAIEAQVCRVEVSANKGMLYGTGFLLGPDVVITNYHVVEAVIVGERGATTNSGLSAKVHDIVLRFDYKRLADGSTLNTGAEYRLATDWLIDASPMSGFDIQPEAGDPDPEELDYALLRVEGMPGILPIGSGSEPDAPRRGWIEVSARTEPFLPGAALFIVQHPQGTPLKLALDTDAIIGVNANGTRVRYKTNTEPGSSGSPCFSSNWELIALHHAGDPNFAPNDKPAYNQGIPFTAILALLDKRGLKGVLGKPPV
ncbi:MAG: serine protease [Chloroflexales bacterium]|nr:serine protease [Chloroflexales bacterium]